MTNPSRHVRNAILCMVIGTLIFCVSLIAFCVALGLDFGSEGWSDARRIGSGGDRVWMTAAVTTCGVSIVMFFYGLHRFAKQP